MTRQNLDVRIARPGDVTCWLFSGVGFLLVGSLRGGSYVCWRSANIWYMGERGQHVLHRRVMRRWQLATIGSLWLDRDIGLVVSGQSCFQRVGTRHNVLGDVGWNFDREISFSLLGMRTLS